MSRQPIYVSVTAETIGHGFNNLSGKYNYHSLRENAPVFVREGGKLDKFDPPPYYFTNDDGEWQITDSDGFQSRKSYMWCTKKGISLPHLVF